MADSFQLLVDDTSPALSFFPFPDTLRSPDLLAGWNPYFTGSTFANPLGEVGEGTSLHITSLDQAAFSVQWFGSAIQLFGNATAATYDVTLDGQTNSSVSSFSADPTLLASYDHLPQTNHTLSLVFHNPTNSTASLIAIDNVLITVSTQSSNCTVATSIVEDTALAFVGQWSFDEDSSVSTQDTTFHTSSNAGDWVSYNFSGSAISVTGIRGFTSGHFSVQLDNDTVILDAQASFKESATLFYRAGLDRSIQHTLTITNREDRQLTIGALNITSLVQPYDQPGTLNAMSSGLPRGTIAAIAVAAVLGFLVACLLLLCSWRRRRQAAILRRRRMFTSNAGSNHSNVINIAPEPDDYLEDKLESKTVPREGSGGSLSFTLDLPIQSRRSRTPSQREYSGNSVQELPRSPTVSLVRPQIMHTRDSSRGALMQDVSASDGVYIDLREQSPFHVEFLGRRQEGNDDQRHPFARRLSSEDSRDEQPQDESTREQVLSLTPPPRVNVIASTPPNQDDGQRDMRYSFLDISSSSQGSSLRGARIAPSTSTSSSSSTRSRIRRFSELSFSPHRPISLPFALQFPRNTSLGVPPRLPSPEPESSPLPIPMRSPLTPMSPIRPLPRIPNSPSPHELDSPPEMPPTEPLLRDTTPPVLHVETQFRTPASQLPRSVSATTPLPSAFASTALHLHPRAHLQFPSATSQTESLPMTVSDIHFRHSLDDDEGPPGSRRSSAGVHRLPHPPLPQRYASPFIMQKLLGGQATLGLPGQSYASGSGTQGSEGPRYAPGLGRPVRR